MPSQISTNEYHNTKKEVKNSRIVPLIKSLSVEPAGFFTVCGLVMAHLLFQNLIMDAACRVDLGYSEDDCDEIINSV